MDYKYIEQLLESYFDCRTTLQEEQILRSFFSQEDVPGHLAEYADLFKYEIEAKEEVLDDEFDLRMLNLIAQEEKPTARTIKMKTRHFVPFFKAAAVVAITLTIGIKSASRCTKYYSNIRVLFFVAINHFFICHTIF